MHSFPRPAIFAHRGASHDAPENTLKAFQLALQQNADGIELDVHLSADQQVVVIHDSDLNRTTNGRGRVEELSLHDLKQLDAGEGETIPTLVEVLELVGDQILLNIELKGFSSDADKLPQAVLGLTRDFGLSDRVIYSSFDPHVLMLLHRLDPAAQAGLLLPPGNLSAMIRTFFSPFVRPWSLHPHFESVTERFIRVANKNNQPVFTYTVNQPEDMRKVFRLGVSGIFTDIPLLAQKVREEFAS
ncbi:MAG: glycerophosphodiester phosphodiesterase [Anaerolineales bacterium]|nr:glycerophosphodiester phosphodiesterase [Anaerolineales bacterium]